METIFGRRVHYPEINTKNPSMRGFLERAAINAPIQGSAADIIRRAMIRMPRALDDARLGSVRMLLQVHDELVFEAKEADVEKALKTIARVMEKAAGAGRAADSADPRRCQGRRQLGSGALGVIPALACSGEGRGHRDPAIRQRRTKLRIKSRAQGPG